MKSDTSFIQLVKNIRAAHDELTAHAGRAVNISLTLRNWLIGYYIVNYELHGEDRAAYGERLLVSLSESLQGAGVNSCGKRQLYGYLRFNQVYPQIVRSVPAQLQPNDFKGLLESVADNASIVRTASALSGIAPQKLIYNLSYSHLELLVAIDDDTKRSFYELECVRGNWSVRELKRQINSLYYERSGLSHDKDALSKLAHQNADTHTALNIRDPYVFEFLGIKPSEVMSESKLENLLADKLQEFMLELGYGFCFEARQKRILIGGEYFFVDLVFYHRVLKCHVLVELKLENFSHENIGQLNTYVSWFRENIMTEGDNPPIGILLCTDKNHALVEYALAGMDNQLFVSKYQLELPKKEDIQRFMDAQLKEVGSGEN